MGTQYSIIRGDEIEYSFWLVFDSSGGVRMSRGKPTVSRDERSVRLTAALPTSLFKTPELAARITVPGQPCEPIQIDIELAREALKAALGVDVDIQIRSE